MECTLCGRNFNPNPDGENGEDEFCSPCLKRIDERCSVWQRMDAIVGGLGRVNGMERQTTLGALTVFFPKQSLASLVKLTHLIHDNK